MANREQLKILKQGVAAWNAWREENPDGKIDLRRANLEGLDLSGANFCEADIRGTLFTEAVLVGANFTESGIGICRYRRKLYFTDFTYSDLRNALFDNAKIGGSSFNHAITTGASWRNIQDDSGNCHFFDDNFQDTILSDPEVRELLVHGNGQGLFLKGTNVKGARFVDFDLRSLDLRETDLRQSNLSGANITGAKFYGSARENWIIDGIRCDYVYWDESGQERTPPNRDFRPGEFEELYKQLPTFEYIFEQGFTPLDPLIMDRVVQAINEKHKEFQLELVNFDKRANPMPLSRSAKSIFLILPRSRSM
jgi:hypothetical protein